MEIIKNQKQWFGEIPSHWEHTRIASVYKLRNTKVSDKDYMPLSVTMKGVVPQLETAAKTDAHDDRKLVKKGDFAINSRSDRRGSCGIAPCDGSISLINIVLCPLRNMNPEYYNWLFHTTEFADEFYKWGHGIVDDLWTTTWQEMKNIIIPLPPIEEQKRIANFLHSECTKIEVAYTDIERQIATLEKYKRSVITEIISKGLNPEAPMKESGIEFIGKIPNDWTVLRVKNIGEYRNGLTYSPMDVCDENEGVLVLRSSNIHNGKLVFEDNVYVSTSIPNFLFVEKDDILICSRNGSQKLIGKNALIPSNLRASFGAFMMVMKCNNMAKAKYVYYLLNSEIFSYYLGTFFTSTINQLTGQNFGNMKIPFCFDLKIQQDIIDYLDKKCGEIDSVLDDKKKQLEILDKYKKSLIYEYVTGKRRS